MSVPGCIDLDSGPVLNSADFDRDAKKTWMPLSIDLRTLQVLSSPRSLSQWGEHRSTTSQREKRMQK